MRRLRTGGERDGRGLEVPAPAGLAERVADALVGRLLDTRLADSVVDRVVETLMRSEALERLITKVVRDLETSQAVNALVDRQVERVLTELVESDAVRALIRAQAGDYLEYLGEHPQPVRRLLQDQSRGVLRELQDRLIERSASADDRLEAWVHRALGRR
jgi:hypothetical protein